jgi:nucleotide-binding universal stress UspA family protein
MRILLAVDGSDNSYEAVRALAYFARAEEVMLLHVLDVPKPAYPKMVPEVANEIYAAVEQAMRVEGECLVDRIASLLPMNTGPVTIRMEIGSPAEVIANVAQERKTDLILMGARGLGPVQARLFGSVSHRIVTLGPCATLIVTGPMRSLQLILLPIQGPYDAEAAVRFLSRTPFREPVDITLLTVLPQTRPPWPAGEAAARRLEEQALLSAQDFVEGVEAKLQAAGYRAKGMAVLGSPVEQILREAGKIKPDLILMGTSGRKGITRFVLGSVSHAVLHQAPCPMLVFR